MIAAGQVLGERREEDVPAVIAGRRRLVGKEHRSFGCGLGRYTTGRVAAYLVTASEYGAYPFRTAASRRGRGGRGSRPTTRHAGTTPCSCGRHPLR